LTQTPKLRVTKIKGFTVFYGLDDAFTVIIIKVKSLINYDTQCHHMNKTEPLTGGYECQARPVGQTKFTRIQVRNPRHGKKIMDWSYSETWRPLIGRVSYLIYVSM